MERFTAAGLMAANKKQSQTTPYTDELLTRLPSAKSGGTSQEDRLAALSDNQRSLLGDLVERIAKFVQMIFEQLGFVSDSYEEIAKKVSPGLDPELRSLAVGILEEQKPYEVRKPDTARAKPSTSEAKAAVLDDVLQGFAEAEARSFAFEQEAVAGPVEGASTTTAQIDNTVAALGAPEPVEESPQLSFIEKLEASESSGKPDASIKISDGRSFVGKLQFGKARLQDYQTATGSTFTQNEFKADEALQDEVAEWHLADLAKAIDALGSETEGYDREGLMAVAHLGGKTGMKRFVKSGGSYNPADELGTSLSDYYAKFSGAGS